MLGTFESASKEGGLTKSDCNIRLQCASENSFSFSLFATVSVGVSVAVLIVIYVLLMLLIHSHRVDGMLLRGQRSILAVK